MSSNPPSPISTLLREGIAAVKSGRLEQARTLLMQVIDQDERNEQAWLWLSGAVETDDDRRVCLENVLMLNPNNAAAQHGLAKLGPAPAGDEHVVRREVAPVSPAAAILHPEAQVKEWHWRDPIQLQQVSTPESQPVSSFDDIWNSDKTLCAYCACEIADDARRCPRCERNLIEAEYHYPEASTSLYYLGAITFSLGLQLFVQTTIDVSRKAPLILSIFDGALTLGALVFALGVYARRRWGYFGTMAVASIALFASLIRITTDLTAKSEIASLVVILVAMAGVLTSLLSLLIGVFRAGRDFELSEVQHAVRLGQPPRRSGDLFHAGKAYADRGMWAMAVPYWQRAAATDPTRFFYQHKLGEAYARLGFYERSLSVLEPALRSTGDEQLKADIERLIGIVRERQSASA